LGDQSARNGHGIWIGSANASGVGDCGVGGDGGHRGQICQSDRKTAPDESANVSRRKISLSLCPWKRKNETDPTEEVLSDPICEIDLNDGDDWRRGWILKIRASDRYRMTLYV
jgi:hypothetical protein